MESTDESPYSNYEPQDQVSTFLLYSKPADQLHTDRDLIVHEEIPSDDEKAKPIYINAANAKDRKSIKILDKKATLSDGQLKALSL